MFDALVQGVLRRRSATLLIALLVFLFGAFAITQLKEELLPNFSFPYIIVTTADPGASSQVVADKLSKPIESTISQLAGLQQISSTSLQGFSLVEAQFDFGIDTTSLQQQITTKLQSASLPALPNGSVVQPTVTTLNFNSAPILYVTVEGQQGQSSIQVAQWADSNASPAFANINGVSNVQVVGDTSQDVVIALDSAAMTQHGLVVSDITNALQAQGITFSAGTADISGNLVPISVSTSLQNAAALGNLIIVPSSSQSGTSGTLKPVHLQDVATVTTNQTYPNGTSRINGTPGVLLQIYKTQNGNTVTTSDGVLKEIKTLNANNPTYKLTTVYDQAQQIRDSIDGLVREGILGAIFAVLVIFLFLRNVRSTLVTAISIPTSIVVALLLLWWQGITLNTLTLGGLAIAVGRVVDDAIVVLENIYRHVQNGDPINEAVRVGTREVAGAITTSTITTVCVFLPLGFVGGITGQIFLPFALTVTFALLASLLVALTIIPVFASYFIKPSNRTRTAAARQETQNTVIQRVYTPILRWGLAHRWATLVLAFGLLVASLASVGIFGIPTGFLPNSNSHLLQATLNTPLGGDPAETSQGVIKMEQVLATYKQEGKVSLYETTISGNSAFDLIRKAFEGGNATATMLITLPANQDDGTIARSLQTDFVAVLPGTDTAAVTASSSTGTSNSLSYIVQGPDVNSVKAGSDAVLGALQGLNGISNLASDVSAVTPQIVITPDPTKSPLANSALIGSKLSQLLSGESTGTISFGDGTSAQIVVVVPGLGGADINTYIANIAGLPLAPGVTIGDVATVHEVDGVTQVTRINQSLAATISADITTNNTGLVTAAAAKRLKNLPLPPGVTVSQSGSGLQQSQAFGGLAVALLAAVALVYLVMVLSFGSLRDPFAILFSLPLAAIGGLGALLITRHELDLSSLIGFLMLIGIVVTNAIVLLDLYKQLRQQGLPTNAALLQAGRTRVRPILMTALATILALLPLALGIGGNEGSIIASDLGVVVIGGLLTSTLLTLLVVPVVTSLLEGTRRRDDLQLAPEPEPVNDGQSPTAPIPALSRS